MAQNIARLDQAVANLATARRMQRDAHDEIMMMAAHLHRCGHSWDWLAHRLGYRTGNALRMAVVRWEEVERRRRRTQPTTGATDTTR